MKKFLQKIYDLASLPVITAMTVIFLSIVSRFVSKGCFLWVSVGFAVTIVLLCVTAALCRRYELAVGCLVILLAGSLFCVRIFVVYDKYDKAMQSIDNNRRIIGYVCEHPIDKRYGDKTAVEFRFKVVGVQTAGITDFIKVPAFSVLVRAEPDSDMTDDRLYRRGDKLRIDSRMTVPIDNAGGFKYRDYLYDNGVYAVVRCDWQDIALLGSQLSLPETDLRFFDRILCKWRHSMIEKYRRHLSEKSFGFFMSVFLGLRSELSREVSDDFRESGMMHLIAISGMHISVIGGIVFFVFGRIFSKSLSYVLSLAVMSLYMSLLPFQPSSQRAFIMYGVVVFFFVFGTKTGRLTGISYAAMILCFINPYCVFNIGFQFSFLATIGIILFNGQINGFLSNFIKGRFFDKIRDNLSVTLSAFCAICIIQAGLFGRIALISMLTSLVIIPMFEFVFFVLLFGGILLYVTNFGLFALIMNAVTEIFLFVINLAGKIPMVTLPKIPAAAGYLSLPVLFVCFNLIFPLLCKATVRLINNSRVHFYEKKCLKTKKNFIL